MNLWVWGQKPEFWRWYWNDRELEAAWRINCWVMDIQVSRHINCMISSDAEQPLLMMAMAAVLSEWTSMDFLENSWGSSNDYRVNLVQDWRRTQRLMAKWGKFRRPLGEQPFAAIVSVKAERGCCICTKLDVIWMCEVVVIEARDAVPVGEKF